MKYLDDLHQQSHEESEVTETQLQTEGTDKTAVATGWGAATLTL